jgi:hypothetical protein
MIRTRPISFALIVAGFMLAAAPALRYLSAHDLIGANVRIRTFQVLIGLVLAVYGNFLPKDASRAAAEGCVSRYQALLRLAGWSFTLAGIAYAALWAVAPFSVADRLAMPIVAAATLGTAGYLGWTALNRRPRRFV